MADDELSRRSLLKLAAASAALAGAPGCLRERREKILPYTRSPRHTTPGVPSHYATSLVLDGFATGVLVKSYDGRPIKVEGNPDHPASLGATTVFDQAAVLGLYDPDRARAMRVPEGAPTWERFFVQFAGERTDSGKGLRFLLEPTGSPLVADLVSRLRKRFPQARFTFQAAGRTGNAAAGARLAFGAPVQTLHDYRRADVVLSLDDDFLASGPFSIRYAHQWAERRRPASPEASMNRLYVVETMLTPTGTSADHRLPRRPGEVAVVAARIAASMAAGAGDLAGGIPSGVAAALQRFGGGPADPALAAIARDLTKNRARAVITVGERQPPLVHALGHVMNSMLGNPDTTWTIAPVLAGAGDQEQDLPSLAAELDTGAVDTLVILQGNPVYTAPRDLDLVRRLAKVKNVVYLGDYEDETAACARWFVPAAHPFESWGDAAAYDGTLSLVQPLIRPLYDGRTPAEMLALFAGIDRPDALGGLRAFWDFRLPAGEREARWEEALRAGLFAGTASPREHHDLAADALAQAIARMPAKLPDAGGIEAAFALDPSVHDGRFANSPWLLELPQPNTHLTWDNAVMLSPATAARLGLRTEDVVDLELGGRTVAGPVLVVAGHADDAATLHLGWGRGGVPALVAARGAGFDAGALRTTQAPWFAPGLAIRKRPRETYPLARTQDHYSTQGRPIALAATIADYRKDPGFTAHLRGPVPTLYHNAPTGDEQWAMTIDTSICTACSSCVVACQSENNVLVVGKEQVLRGREMHWLRIDTYHQHEGAAEPKLVHEPMLCQHCERAPCEYVCPVNATVHSPDGLNEMVYNRCVGTRFCSNNCPYKVRRFNWFDWNDEVQNGGTVTLQHNPDVTVRQRGVMEKCTYCVQRIRETEIHARVAGRAIRPGEVVTACQQACPTGAIQFGSLRHEETPMVKRRREPRAFAVLHELGTTPRTMYLARIDNPNPEIG